MRRIFLLILILTSFSLLVDHASALRPVVDHATLLKAAESGNVNAIKDLLEKGADVNAIDEWGNTALSEAARAGHIAVVKLLIDKGADVNAKDDKRGWIFNYTFDRRGMTALMWAAERGHTEVVKFLIEKGADVNARNSGGWTALSFAARAGHIEVVKLLIKKGADIDSAIVRLESLESIDDPKFKAGAKMLERLRPKQEIASQPVTIVSKSSQEAASVVKSDIDELPLKKAKLNKNSYAIVIGIENYRQKLPKADFATADAKTVTEYLTKVMGYPEENVVTLLNEHATNVDFAKYFEKWLPNNVEKDGTVFIYYSGHGAPNPKTGDAYLVPYDGDPSFIEQTGYPLKRLYESLNKLQAKEIIVALDSCFSGAGGKSVIAKGSRPLVMNLEQNMKAFDKLTVLSAASGEQTSSTYDEKGHGLFTYFMLKGIKNEDVTRQDGSIKMDDLFGYIKPQVERIARKQHNNEQTPQLIGGKIK